MGPGDDDPFGWPDLIQVLVDNGHPPQVVMQYTVQQVWWWVGAISRRNQRHQKQHERDLEEMRDR